ncbi:MAG: uroporphyrinogen-III C-methyltransferase [bacterium]|nr:uroporphyrinogen-III C-methyltransferase [bacterium]
MSGKVWLVGAGPGSADLLTRKGERILKEAEVVLYDRLVDVSVLLLINEQAECIDVGKCSGYHKMSQEVVNELLCEKALEGKRVVRLKGGDPFVFGRGEEEIAVLRQKNIAYEVVPGVTSPIAVPECAGIPVTARGISSAFYVVTAHHRKQQTMGIDYQTLVALKDTTLIFLMGIGKVREITTGLLAAGKSPDCPTAVIQEGATSRQKVIYATLQELEKKVEEENITPPGIILVGEVCRFAQMFWSEDSLKKQKRRVIVTRPKDKNKQLIRLLGEEGLEVMEQPMISIGKVEAGQTIKALAEDITPTLLAFTSEPGVRYFFQTLQELKIDIRTLAHIEFAVIGEKTKEALRERGIMERILSSKPYGAQLGRELLEFVLKEERKHKIVVATPHNKKSECYAYLQKNGRRDVELMALPLYRTDNVTSRFFEWREQDIVTFTSASCVDGFAHNMKGDQLRYVQAVCIGKTTFAKALDYHMRAVMSKEATMESMVQCVLDLI